MQRGAARMRRGPTSHLPAKGLPAGSFRNKASRSMVHIVGSCSSALSAGADRWDRVPVSEHGINATAPLHTVPVMSVSGSTLYAAGYSSSSDSGAELWKATIADEGWTRAASIPMLQRPLSMAVHGGALYIGGYDNTLHSMLVRNTLDDAADVMILPLPDVGIGVRSLLSMENLISSSPSVGGYGGREGRMSAGLGRGIAHEIGRGRRHVHEIVLARGWPAGEMLVGTARENPGGAGVPGTGAEVWRGSDYGSRGEQLAADGFGNPNTGAVPYWQCLEVFGAAFTSMPAR